MAGSSRMGPNVYLMLGIGLLCFFALSLGVGLTSDMFELFAVACVPTTLIPGVILAAIGLKGKRRDRELMEFSSWVKSYRRIALTDVARKLNKSEFETDKILVEVVDRGMVAGFIDRQTNEFVLKEEIGRSQYVESCNHCGASLKRQYPLGETVLCPYCGSVILGPPPPPQQQPPPQPYYYPPPGGYPPYGPPPQGPGRPPGQ